MDRRSLPPRFEHADLSTLHPSFQCVTEYADALPVRVRSGEGLFLSGPPGVGKTYALAALTKHASGRIEYDGKDVEGRPCRRFFSLKDYIFVTGPALFESYALPYDAGDKDKTHELERVPWLVLNDLGKEYRGGAYSQQVPYKLGRLIRARVESGLTTHITTNLVLHASEESNGMSVQEVYGESIYSLLMECCPYRYEVSGPDRRRSDNGSND